MELQSSTHLGDEWMYFNPVNYGCKLTDDGFEPNPTMDPIALQELMELIHCNSTANCNNRRSSCKKKMDWNVEIVKELLVSVPWLAVILTKMLTEDDVTNLELEIISLFYEHKLHY